MRALAETVDHDPVDARGARGAAGRDPRPAAHATATTRRRSSRTASARAAEAARLRGLEDERARAGRRGRAAAARRRGRGRVAVDPARAGPRAELGGAVSRCSRSSASRPPRSPWRSGAGPAARDDPAVEVDGDAVAFDAIGHRHRRVHVPPNPGEPARPLARIASGGELSRVALAIKQVLAEVDATPDARVRRGRHRHRWADRRPGRSQPVDARPGAPGAVRDAPAADRGLRRRPLPDREARAGRAHRDARSRRSTARSASAELAQMLGGAAGGEASLLSARELLDRAEAWRGGRRRDAPSERGRRDRRTSTRRSRTYLAYLRVERGLSDATIRAYDSDLTDFAMSRGADARLGGRAGGRAAATSRPGRDAAGRGDPGLAPTSLRRRTASIRGFYRFAYGDELIAIDVAGAPRPAAPAAAAARDAHRGRGRAAARGGRRRPPRRSRADRRRRASRCATGRCSSCCTRAGLRVSRGARPRPRAPVARRGLRCGSSARATGSGWCRSATSRSSGSSATSRGRGRPGWPRAGEPATAPGSAAVRHAARSPARPPGRRGAP